jgi:hypothetical protein
MAASREAVSPCRRHGELAKWADEDSFEATNNSTAGPCIIFGETMGETERFYICQPWIMVTTE